MSQCLTETEIAHYHADGYVEPLRILSTGDAVSYCKRLEQFIGAHGGPTLAEPALRTKAHLCCPALLELVHLPAILDAVCAVLGPNVLCRSSSVFLKDAHNPDYVAWHQDAAYWDLEPPDVVTAWVALTPSTIENGALQVLPGSHRGGLLPHQTKADPANLLSRGQTIAPLIDARGAVPLILAAGEMSLHHVLLAHCSEPNRSAERRLGYAIRYVSAHVRKHGPRRDSALLVRGVDRFGHFDPEPERFKGKPVYPPSLSRGIEGLQIA